MSGTETFPPDVTGTPHGREISRLRDISRAQWKSGLAAWLGWLFDGLDLHLYTLVAMPFVAELLATQDSDPRVKIYSSWIQASFLVGWALGGGFFGRIGDRLGRTRALALTILTYALFTGLSFFAHTWWQLFIFRFLAALGIGGEWAVGASLLSETWPRRWRPWMAAVLQTGCNLGILLACSAYWMVSHVGLPNRSVFLVGVLPALIVLWIRRSVPESDEWHAAATQRSGRAPGVADLFRGGIRRTTLLAMAVCATALTGHWAFLFWSTQHLRGILKRDGWPASQAGAMVAEAFMLVIGVSIVGNFLAAALARWIGFRRAIALLCLAYFGCLMICYGVVRDHRTLLCFMAAIGVCHGVFALFTMYLPPLFPTLLRTTGAGFCFNIGRIAAAAGTVLFGLFVPVDDFRFALQCAAFLFIPAGAIAMFLPELPGSASREQAGTS